MAERQSNSSIGDNSSPDVLEYGHREQMFGAVAVFAYLAAGCAIGAWICVWPILPELRHDGRAKLLGVTLGVLSMLFAGKAAFTNPTPTAPSRKTLLGIFALIGLAGTVGNLVAGSSRTYDLNSSINWCGYRMHDLDQRLWMFASEHSGRFPNSLSEFKELPEGFDESRVVYLGAGLSTSSPANVVLLHDKVDVHGGRGIHVIYADGRLVWVKNGEVEAVMETVAAQSAKRPKRTAP